MYDQMTADRYTDMAVLRTFLHDGEEVLWTGRPYSGAPYRPPLSGVISSLFVVCFSLFWMALAATGSPFFALFGTPFLAIGLYTFATVVFGAKRQMARTLYAVTDRRAIILTENRRGTECTEYVFSRMQSVRMDRVQGNVGCIRFRDDIPYGGVNYRVATTRYHVPASSGNELRMAFLMIDNVHTVYRLISERIG